jgi:hypothetical protein
MGTIAALVAILLAGVLSNAPSLQAQSINYEDILNQIEQGSLIAPVPLNITGKDPSLVFLGSYLVNTVGDCNGCHSSGTPASLGIYPYTPGHNPYFNQPQQLDPSVYLNGGVNFGSVGTPTGPLGYAGPAIITRNLTPDYTGKAEGGHTLAQFTQILKHGKDFDHIHPPCLTSDLQLINNPPNGVTTIAELEPLVHYCIPTGVIDGTGFNNEPDGNLLQIMPWPSFSYLTDNQIAAIYVYLSSIPCIDNTTSTPPDGAPTELQNNCGGPANPDAKTPSIQPAAPRMRR